MCTCLEFYEKNEKNPFFCELRNSTTKCESKYFFDPSWKKCRPHCPESCKDGYCKDPNVCICNEGFIMKEGACISLMKNKLNQSTNNINTNVISKSGSILTSTGGEKYIFFGLGIFVGSIVFLIPFVVYKIIKTRRNFGSSPILNALDEFYSSDPVAYVEVVNASETLSSSGTSTSSSSKRSLLNSCRSKASTLRSEEMSL
ncbi:hypothetical protein HHI36_012061 [Cryptolaemus montrouzieri]|uniref:Uncharacterized protein n=1 Tax=Cryptolaemus montrouzieri TaxID=559131 RepID=A0ABD2NDE7_9CUCU